MLEMYTITGGGWFRESFNAIAAFMNTDGFKYLIRFATVVAILLTIWQYIKLRDYRVFLYWLFVITFSNIMITSKKSIQIIDNSQPGMVYQVDNVPMGLALPAHLFTFIGQGILEGYERVFHLPDSITYSNGGMLFGANLVVKSTDFVSINPEVSGLFSDYVQNCVIGDIYLNHKYSLDDLMNSTDPYTLIFSNPSPLRGVFDKNGKYQTCAVAATELTKAIGLDTQTGGTTWNYYVRSLFAGRPDAELLMGELLGSSYQHFYGASQSASEIMKKNVTINALRKGILSYASRNGDAASLLNLSETTALSKLRLSQATAGEITARQLPVMQTVILGILIGLFPVIILLGMISVITIQVWKGYITAIIWLQSWPLLFAILNHSMSYNLQQSMNGQVLTLSSVSTLQQNFSDIATMSAWISGFIPFISYSLIALGRGLSQAGSYMGTATQSASAQSSSQATDGTWAFNNMQTDNVQGYKWDTNSATSAGQMSSQTISGGTMTRTAGGNTVYNSSGAMSQLPVHIGWSNRLSSAYQTQAREAEQQATSFQKGYSDGLTYNATQASQLSQQLGNSRSLVEGFDSTESRTKVEAFNRMNSIAEQYAKANNISQSQAFNELMDKSTRGTVSGSVKAGAKASAGLSALGNGVQVYGDTSVSGSVQGASGSSHGTSTEGRQSSDYRNDKQSQMLTDFRSSMDLVASDKISASGSRTDNSSLSKLDQFGSSLNKMRNDFEQYSSTSTRSKEYSELATKAKDTSAQIESNYDQQFADWVTKNSPENAHDILTNTSSPSIAREREMLAQKFVDEELAPRLADEYHVSDGQTRNSHDDTQNKSVQNVDNLRSERKGPEESFRQSQIDLTNAAVDSGIKGDITDKVNQKLSNVNTDLSESKTHISNQQEHIINERNSIIEEHQTARNDHSRNYNKERLAQGEKVDYDDVIKDDPRNKQKDSSRNDLLKGGD